jgi:TetR/AcrR family transcriptional regulator, lmrAB and yxaGH operons repressor
VNTPAPDRRYRDTRARLVRSATGLFRRRGVAATGIAAICAAAGTTKGVFAHHFPGGKCEIIAAVVTQNSADVALALRSVGESGNEPAAQIRSIFAQYAAIMQTKGPDFGCPVAAAITDGTHIDKSAEPYAAFTSWRAALAPTLAEPGRSIADLDYLVIAAVEGAILIARAEHDPDVLNRVGAALATMIASTNRAKSRKT